MDRNIYQLFANAIRELRIRHGLTQAECATLAGVERRFYRRLEEGKARRITLPAIKRLARVFGLQTGELLEAMERAAED